MRLGTAALVAAVTGVAAGCRGSLSPLSNRLQVGQEPYVVFVADGEEGAGDLFASSTAGGAAYQVTFTRVDERAPSLSPDGTMMAFLRTGAPGSQGGTWLVVMNLLNGAERRVEIGATPPDGVAWSSDGSRVYLRSGDSLTVTPAPPAALALTRVAPAERPGADSLFRVLLGHPPLAEAVPCGGGALCARFANGREQQLTQAGSSPIRWPGDSVMYREGDAWVVRPLGGGETRQLSWQGALGRPRDLTVFGGAGHDTD